jgi:trans-aconitate methyltransferase
MLPPDLSGSSVDWNAERYDQKLGFVSSLGKGVLDWLRPKIGERILDLGCGTGDLAWEIAGTGATVSGLDSSSAMITAACSKYPALSFHHGYAENFAETTLVDERYHAIFSNAALHWVKDASAVIRQLAIALVPGGRFAAEFGGNGNVETITGAIDQVLSEEFGLDADLRNPWYFPSLGEYATLLEEGGLRVTQAIHFDRPTLLADGEQGLTLWLDTFGAAFFVGFAEDARAFAYQRIEELCRPALYRDGGWYADYKRLRVLAVTSNSTSTSNSSNENENENSTNS